MVDIWREALALVTVTSGGTASLKAISNVHSIKKNRFVMPMMMFRE